ncbi:response regulator transcription factor [Brachybacterium sacelli]|uniref:Two-component system response regulator DesR n=1 Tax=Brachybacterium sacelli TaxID=173364 RepID=A0ABS4X8U4_9MICO|nr:response regulator transcription factor [Brachybacterium sacelli]MBP2384114.1 two-component system response regulator DesR [Brachybacterium sacelli]
MIHVFLADDEDMLRTALVSLLELEDSLTVVGHGGTGRAALEHEPASEVDVHVLDLEMPDLDGVDTARALVARDPEAAIVMITRHARPGILRSALAAGVRGFVPKSTSADQLARVIERVHAGGRYVDPELAVTALGFDCPLTEREVDVLRLTHQGLPVAEIAAHLHLAQGTVRNYLSDAIAKLGVADRHAAAREARAHGWI